MNKFKNFSKKLLKNQSGQGATEYILLVVVIIALVVAFKKPILDAVGDKASKLGSSISGFDKDTQ